MKSKITKYINLCALCKKSKYERHPYKIKYKQTDTPKRPLEIVHTDIFIMKDKHYLTFCDKFSRLALAVPIKTRYTVHILKGISTFIATVGKPLLLIMDQECSFKSIAVQSFLNDNLIKYHYTSVAQSSSNGTVEIVHRTIREIHNILSQKESTKDLSESTKINLAVATYNDSIHSETNFTPNELFRGFRNDQPISSILDEHIQAKEKLYAVVHHKMLEQKEKRIAKLNEKREEPICLSEGETVFLRKKTI